MINILNAVQVDAYHRVNNLGGQTTWSVMTMTDDLYRIQEIVRKYGQNPAYLRVLCRAMVREIQSRGYRAAWDGQGILPTRAV